MTHSNHSTDGSNQADGRQAALNCLAQRIVVFSVTLHRQMSPGLFGGRSSPRASLGVSWATSPQDESLDAFDLLIRFLPISLIPNEEERGFAIADN